MAQVIEFTFPGRDAADAPFYVYAGETPVPPGATVLRTIDASRLSSAHVALPWSECVRTPGGFPGATLASLMRRY